ncbi:cyclic nucleotide-binding domain-containing protein [Crossiella sp. NPDC003009]
METFEPGQQIHSEGDVGDRIHGLGAGMVKIGRADRVRRCRLLAVLGPGQLVDAFAPLTAARSSSSHRWSSASRTPSSPMKNMPSR